MAGRRRSKKRQARSRRLAWILLALFFLLALVLFIHRRCSADTTGDDGRGGLHIQGTRPELDVQLLSVNPYSRPGIEVDHIDGIVIHYTANAGASAQANRNYFEQLAKSKTTKASSNFIIGLQGEVIQCIPTWELAYASNQRNGDTVSIECCHADDTGYFNDATYRSLVQLTGWLCQKYGLSADKVIRHYDVTGKNCPKYFVEHEDAWKAFRADVDYAIKHGE